MRLWLMRVVVIHQYTKFEVRRRRSEDMAHDMCVNTNGSVDLDL